MNEWFKIKLTLNFTNIVGAVIAIKGITTGSWQIVGIGAILVLGRSIAKEIIDAWSKKS